MENYNKDLVICPLQAIFKTIRYEIVGNGDEDDLVLTLDENPNKTFIRLGGHYDDLYKSAAIINLTRKSFLLNDDVGSFDFILGDNVRYNMEYYVDKGFYWSFGIKSRFNSFEKEVDFDLIRANFDVPDMLNVNTINLDFTDFTNQIYVQTLWKEEFSLSMGLEHKFLKYSTRTLGQFAGNSQNEGSASVNENQERVFFDKSNYYNAFGQLKLDTYDDKYFPSRGLYFEGDYHFYILSSDFNDNFKEFSIVKAKFGAAFPIVENLSMNINTEGGFKLGIF